MIHLFRPHNFAGHTCVIPSVGVGNVAQLAADLLISTLSMERIGTVWHPAIIPICGADAFERDDNSNDDNLTTACELYVAKEPKLLVFQIRSPLVATLMTDFFMKIIDFLCTNKIGQLIVLTSSYAYEMHAVEATPYQSIGDGATFPPAGNSTHWSAEYKDDIIHGGGYAKKFMELAVAGGIATVILFKYVSEGDNRPDAVGLVGYFNEFLGYKLGLKSNEQDTLKMPISWKYLFGNNAPLELY